MDEIAQLRRRIDEIDDQILAALCERVKIARKIGAVKRKQGIPIHDTLRESAVYRRVKQKATEMGLDNGEVEVVYREIVNMCSSVQE